MGGTGTSLRSLLPCNSQSGGVADMGLSHGCYPEIFLSSCCVSGVIESWLLCCRVFLSKRVPRAHGDSSMSLQAGLCCPGLTVSLASHFVHRGRTASLE